MPETRIGHGFDVHAFGPGGHIILGGVSIAYTHGVVAHSDGDVLLHAISDALLGAAGKGDIGQHFPDEDVAYAGVDSRALLRQVVALLTEERWHVVNVDATVVAQAPRIGPYVDAMRANIAEDLAVGVGAVSVKATTTERLGFVGRCEGVAVQAIALIER